MKINTMSGKETLLTTRWRSDSSAVTETFSSVPYATGFHKPDTAVHNPLVNGYRKPSDYSCSAFSTLDTTTYSDRWTIVPYNVEAFDETSVYDWWSGKFIQHFTRSTGTGVYPLVLPDRDLNANNVRMKVLNNVKDEVLDVAMVLAEISGTVDTVGGNLLRIARSLDAVRKGKPESFMYLMHGRRRDGRRPTDKFLRETAGTYLEWKYGIMPTILDVQGATEALDINSNGSLFDNPPLMVARAVDKSTRTINSTIRVKRAGSSSVSVPVSVTVKNELKARLDFSVRGDALRGLSRYGLGLGTVATVAFDKTPFSFVLNMAVPIAELIKAWTALAGVDVMGYCETYYEEATINSAKSVLPIQGIMTVVDIEQRKKHWTNWSRKAYREVPMPIPFVRNPVKPGNLATVLSLFTQLRKRDLPAGK